jgi:hypothetical protein
VKQQNVFALLGGVVLSALRDATAVTFILGDCSSRTRTRLMNRQALKDSLGWGLVLWFIGYVLGILLFPVVQTSVIGWVIMPIGTVITLWVLLKKVQSESFQDYVVLSVVWTLIAVVCDYLLLVKLFEPSDGYYKLDVYAYYSLTFLLPLIVGWRKQTRGQTHVSC